MMIYHRALSFYGPAHQRPSLRVVEPRYHLLKLCDEQSTSVESVMNLFRRCVEFVWPDKRSGSEQARDRAFIAALNKLESLCVTPNGGMSIDPAEIREQVIASRQSLKRFVRRP
jgi:hypothetical protein